MELTKFCPECGSKAKQLYGDERKLCGDCYTNKRSLIDLPDKLTLKICPECDRVKINDEWRASPTSWGRLELVLSSYFEDMDADFKLLSACLNGTSNLRVFRHGLNQTVEFNSEVEDVVCRDCKGFQGGYAKTKIQVRGDDIGSITGLIKKRCSTLEDENHEDFLIDTRAVDGGVDFFLSTEHMSQQIMDTVSKEFEISVDRSYRQVGHRNGEPVVQNTVLVRYSKK